MTKQKAISIIIKFEGRKVLEPGNLKKAMMAFARANKYYNQLEEKTHTHILSN